MYNHSADLYTTQQRAQKRTWNTSTIMYTALRTQDPYFTE